MAVEIAQWFRAELNDLHATLVALPPALANIPWREGGWTRKQIVGHLLDSATNNRQRFVRASTSGEYAGPTYDQDAWVAAHGYSTQPWETLLLWWTVEHDILMEVVDRVSEEHLDMNCIVGNDEPVTLRFLIEDYVSHHRWHMAQLITGVDSGHAAGGPK